MRVCVIGLIGAVLITGASTSTLAQFTVPGQPAAPDPQTLFLSQCGTCHSATKDDDPRQGPNLFGVVGRRAGTVSEFEYSEGFARADWVWDPEHLDAWLTNPQALIKSAVMNYHQPDPQIRHTIIDWLKEQH